MIYPKRYYLGFALAVLPAVVYFGCVVHYATNIPRGDDYLSIFPFLCDWLDASTAGQKFTLVFAQYFSHRIAVTKIVVLAQFFLTGQCNLLWLQAVGWIGWLGLTSALALSVPRVRTAPWLSLPFFLLLMQPQGYSNLHTAMQAVGNIAVLAFAWTAFVASQRSRALFGCAVVSAVCASFSAVNGLLVFPVAALGLALLGRPKRAALFGLCGLATGCAYFWGFVNAPGRIAPVEFLGNAAAMAGGPTSLLRVPLAASVVAGIVILMGSGGVLLLKRAWQALPAHAAFLLFLLLSIAMAAHGRIGWGYDYMLQDRYRAYGLLCMAVVLLFALEWTPNARQRILFLAAGTVTVVFCLLSYLTFLPEMVGVSRWCEATAVNRQLGNDFLLQSPGPWDASTASLHRAEERGVYSIPHYLSAAEIEAIRTGKDSLAPAVPAFRAEPNGAVRGYLLTPTDANAMPRVPDFAVLQQGARMLVLPRQVTRARLGDVLRRRSVFSASYAFILPEAVWEAGHAELHAWARERTGQLTLLWTAPVEPVPSSGDK